MSNTRTLLHPYFFLNVFACLSYILTRNVQFVCRLIYSKDDTCQLDYRDQEIMLFLCFVIVIKNRRWKPHQWTEYISNVFMFTKGATMLMFSRKDYRLAALYAIFCIVIFIIVPEPRYKGPDNIKYFRGQALEEEVLSNPKTVYVIEFYTSWSSKCTHFGYVFADLSLAYENEYLKFGKLDVGRYPQVSKRFNIDASVTSKQLPTLVLFVNGQEKMRKPVIDKKGVVWPYSFTKENIIKDFNLNEHYAESKKLAKSANKNENKKSVPSIKSKSD